ncbi:L-lysine 2,3-aminomutase [uncultured Desulfatiglans sp.]|uniref:L-lysine 2,3-aminomutase n=1 Tax=Uncultured Desulfatiglans sp. TaxID=1748965 RepID=A0A653A0D8_UNCDX|nr:L-lysine 2,3-aminomutase [uncultured Desulfatiglans sp.]
MKLRRPIPLALMNSGPADSPWEEILAESVTGAGMIAELFGLDADELKSVTERYPMRINPYYLGLIRRKHDPIYRQCIPDIREIRLDDGLDDPLAEEAFSPVPGLTHRYPDRVLFLVSASCAMYCRFCNRKRKVGRPSMVNDATIEAGLAYIRRHEEIRDVLLSGGDPLLLSDERLGEILSALRAISHVEIIRIGSRVPCTLPHRITQRLTDLLKQFHPLYLNTHFNHPDELTPEAGAACVRLADAGIPLGCQTVLLRGVNDDPGTMRELMQKLLMVRVRPYYLFQADLARGTAHFWTPLEKGIEIIRELQGHTSGLCLPHFAIDLPGGGGKIPFLPQYVESRGSNSLEVKNFRGQTFRYPLSPF